MALLHMIITGALDRQAHHCTGLGNCRHYIRYTDETWAHLGHGPWLAHSPVHELHQKKVKGVHTQDRRLVAILDVRIQQTQT